MNWLITGGCGFIGCGLLGRLLAAPGHSVRVVDNLSTGTRDDLAAVTEFTEIEAAAIGQGPRGVELLVADIREAESAVSAARGIDVIVHLAANTGVGPSVENPRLDCEANEFSQPIR